MPGSNHVRGTEYPEVFRGFPQSLQAHEGLVHIATITSFHILSHALFTHHHIIVRYIASNTDSVVKRDINK
jgi:hypothetical protein